MATGRGDHLVYEASVLFFWFLFSENAGAVVFHLLFTPSQNEDTKGFPFNRPGMLTAPRVTTHPFHD